MFLWLCLSCASSGPVGFIPGGPFSEALYVGPEPDWSFASGLDTVDVQISPESPRTVRTGIIVHEGVPYLPVTWSPLKRWPAVVRREPRILLRTADQVYARDAIPIDDAIELDLLRSVGQAKYGAPFHARSTANMTFYFRLDPPRAAPESARHPSEQGASIE